MILSYWAGNLDTLNSKLYPLFQILDTDPTIPEQEQQQQEEQQYTWLVASDLYLYWNIISFIIGLF